LIKKAIPFRAQIAIVRRMDQTLFLALVGFAFVSSITPGPNNMMLLASGANFGLRRSVPHLLGVSFGHAFMIVILGAGLIQVFDAFPMTLVVMKWVSVTYLVYLAWKIANSAPKKTEGHVVVGKPFTSLQAAAFQWVNPKGWFMALTALSAYTETHTIGSVLLVAGVFASTNLPCCTTWVTLGQQMRRFLTSSSRMRAFNWTMAVLLLLTLVPILRGH